MTDTQNQNRERVSDEPVMVSLDAGAAVEDDCPMSYDVENDSTCITFGDTRACVNLWLSDMALLNLAAMAKSAARTMLHKRGNFTIDPAGS